MPDKAYEKDLSILIVHTYELKTLRQTLRSLRRAAPQLNIEMIVIDNNPAAGLFSLLKREFPEAGYISNEKNLGFGGAMNVGIRASKGEYILIFNPDIVVQPGSLEELKRFMDTSPDVGIVGPKLLNADGTLQHSCYRLPTLMLPAYRRTPLGKLQKGRAVVEHYLMMDEDHHETMDVDSLIGAALFTRRSALDQVGLFVEQFFLYYEDIDLCRRFWENGYRVVYHPQAQMVHYHKRASAQGNLFQQLLSRFAWIHMHSFWKYWKKYRDSGNPREAYFVEKLERPHGRGFQFS
ncbi:glycosyltransferase family 2 protein [Patescibacteria group bacterium]|nr:glycosyltransferase family 2 protein [Patescibacteria group bacterium]